MELRKLRADGITKSALAAIVQLIMVTRRALATILYREVSDGNGARYTDSPVALSRAVERLKTNGYITEVTYDGKKYLAATALGKDYCRQYDLPTTEALGRLSAGNINHRKTIVANSDALTFARSARILALPAEKPEFAEFATLLGSLTVFNPHCEYSKKELMKDLDIGICYSKWEMWEAYNNSSISGMNNNSSQRIGMVFDAKNITVIYQMKTKTKAFFLRGELEFDNIIKKDLGQFYRQREGYHIQAYILVPTMNYLPTFFHGSVDGIESTNRHAAPAKSNNKVLTNFKIDRLPLYDKIYMLPAGERYVDYREALKNYTDADYDYDKAEFERSHPHETNVVICRYPELVQLRKKYTSYDYCTLVGPGDEKTVDLLSRCMRNRLLKYFDIDSGKEIKFRRYNSKGLPLVKNTNQIDYKAPWKLGGKFIKKD